MQASRLTIIAAMMCAASAWAARDGQMELQGKVTGSSRSRALRVTLFGVGSTFTASTFTDPAGQFSFHGIPAGTYTVSIMRRSLGEIRRTVVVTASLADRKRTVRMSIPYSAAEAAASKRGGTISAKQLSIPPKAWNLYGDAQKRMARSDVQGAGAKLRRAIEIAPGFTAAWNGLGIMSYQDGKLKEAEDFFRTALKSEPEAFEPTVNLGGVLLNQGRPSDALPFNRKAVESHPSDALAEAQLGINYFELGDFEHAEPALRAAKTADPAQSTRPQIYLSRIYLDRGDRAAALAELEDCVAKYPDAPDAGTLRQQIDDLKQP